MDNVDFMHKRYILTEVGTPCADVVDASAHTHTDGASVCCDRPGPNQSLCLNICI